MYAERLLTFCSEFVGSCGDFVESLLSVVDSGGEFVQSLLRVRGEFVESLW